MKCRGGLCPRTLIVVAVLGGLAGCATATAVEGRTGGSILFIGNSLTYTNDLPAVLATVARAAHDSIEVAMVAGPNLAVIDHTGPGDDAIARIDRGGWTYVVLQQGPTPAGVCRDTLVIAAMRLEPHIRRAGARTALFLPWTRQGSPQSLAFAAASAELAARAVGGVVAPVGIAWQHALAADPSAPLYASDGYHPAPAGTLLAALTLYDRLFGRDVRAVPTDALVRLMAGQLTPARIHALAAAAHAASTAQPADPTTPAPPDTTIVSAAGAPC